MKTKLEVVWCDDGSAFLNFWDSIEGKDVCCQVDKDGHVLSENGDGPEFGIAGFLERVREVVFKREGR